MHSASSAAVSIFAAELCSTVTVTHVTCLSVLCGGGHVVVLTASLVGVLNLDVFQESFLVES